jgi:hypothetical protein
MALWIASATPAVTAGKVNFPTAIALGIRPPELTVFCCISLRRMPLKYAIAGLVALA